MELIVYKKRTEIFFRVFSIENIAQFFNNVFFVFADMIPEPIAAREESEGDWVSGRDLE